MPIYNGQQMTWRQLGEAVGINPRTLANRVNAQGWTLERAVSHYVMTPSEAGKVRAEEVRRQRSLSSRARANGLKPQLAINRVGTHGWDEERAVKRPPMTREQCGRLGAKASPWSKWVGK